jgi:hypothetical protein
MPNVIQMFFVVVLIQEEDSLPSSLFQIEMTTKNLQLMFVPIQ